MINDQPPRRNSTRWSRCGLPSTPFPLSVPTTLAVGPVCSGRLPSRFATPTPTRAPRIPGIAECLLPTSHMPEWLRESLNDTWFMHPVSNRAPSWLTSIDHRIDWFALANDHPELVLENPHTRLLTPAMMRDAVALARTRQAQVVTYAVLGPGRDTGTITCGLSALYIAADHDPTLIVDITDMFGGITPEPSSGPNSIPALSNASDLDRVYFGWEWFSMPWPDNPHGPHHRSIT
jgi:hypothetical protein